MDPSKSMTEHNCSEESSHDYKFIQYIPNSKRPYHQTACQQLEDFFQSTPAPSREQKLELAAELNLHVQKVDNWFQNRRAKQSQLVKSFARQADGKSYSSPVLGSERDVEQDSTCVSTSSTKPPWMSQILN
ncbi:hypothetical protein DSO57_1006219 [Entomophthora muscae]|uniref:Uncharacterized protein n=1 Tax=Entomophthora muscae TaxID=34485 RepID=A0ACC2S9M6_9FUNG|nr:hypothetical protein DSO57_1006219 [Entomophthora muscae]